MTTVVESDLVKIGFEIKKRERVLLSARSPVCAGCGQGNVPLACNPIISYRRCKELDKVELCMSKENLPLMCKACIHVWDWEPYSEKRKLADIKPRVMMLKTHDPVRYQIFSILEKQFA